MSDIVDVDELANRIHRVRVCRRCPFMQRRGDMVWTCHCKAAERSFTVDDPEPYGDETPEWCPLRKGAHIVELDDG